MFEVQHQLVIHDVHELVWTDFKIFWRLFVDGNFKVLHYCNHRCFHLHVREFHSRTDSRAVAEGNKDATIFKSLHSTMLGIEPFGNEVVRIWEEFYQEMKRLNPQNHAECTNRDLFGWLGSESKSTTLFSSPSYDP